MKNRNNMYLDLILQKLRRQLLNLLNAKQNISKKSKKQIASKRLKKKRKKMKPKQKARKKKQKVPL